MKNVHYKTSISFENEFKISISEEVGWIEPVFLFISPNLQKVLRLDQEPCYLIQVNHFEVFPLTNADHNKDIIYAMHFLDSEDLIIGNSENLRIKRATYIGKKVVNSTPFSSFNYFYCFEKPYDYQEYCFFYVANNISYLTSFSGVTVTI